MGPILRRPIFTLASTAVLWVLASCYAVESTRKAPADSTATPRAEQGALLPDMTTLPASSISIESAAGGTRTLRFGTTLVNLGIGPIEVAPDSAAPCPKGQRFFTQEVTLDANGDGRYSRDIDKGIVRRDGACVLFHPDHKHWHIDGSARYELQDTAGETLVSRRKVSFCLRDTERQPRARSGATYGKCSRDKLQGISPGWGDLYDADLSGQTLRLPSSLDNGTYCLVMRADPFDYLTESDKDNNTSVTAINISGTDVSAASSARCPAA